MTTSSDRRTRSAARPAAAPPLRDGATVPRSGRLEAEVVDARSLDPLAREEMWGLFRAYYEGASRRAFEVDLAEKNDVILLRDTGDRSVQGFSTLLVSRHRIAGRRLISIFSGDTIVAREYWGQKALHKCFVRYVTGVKLRHPLTTVYWLLISKGYKTYLLLTRNFPTHWPRHDRPTPRFERTVLDRLSRQRFGDAWVPQRGVLRFGEGKDHLRDGVAPVTEEARRSPDVRFFAARNPGHDRGDELVCLGRVDAGLAAKFLGKLLLRPFRRRRPRSG